MESRQSVLILDYGSQYTQLIARRIRESSVYCEIHPGTIPVEKITRDRAERHHPLGRPAERLRRRLAQERPGLVRPRACRSWASATASS